MKLSMWMLVERLEKYNCRSEITVGEPAISGVRFFSGDLSEFSFEYVYMGAASEVFSDSRYNNTILLVHGHDLIFVEGQKMEVVLNEILSAFDYYNSWEARLWEASNSTEPLQKVVDVAWDLLHLPMRFSGSEGNIVALSHEYGADEVDDQWRIACETGYIPLRSAGPKMTTRGMLVPHYTRRPEQYLFTDSGFKYIAVDIYADSEPVANLMIWEHERIFSRSTCQIVDVLCRVLTSIAVNQDKHTAIRSSAAVLTDLLEGREVDAEKRMRLVGNSQPPWQLLVIRGASGDINRLVKNRLLTALRQMEGENLSLLFEDDVITLVSSSDIKRFMRHFGGMLEEQYKVGISLPFSDLDDLPVRRGQAIFAIEKGRAEPGIYYCSEYAFEHLIESMRDHSRALELIHPALDELRRYDEVQRSQLYETLINFILNERNLVATANSMFIHRNTLVFRVKRILEIISADLDDPIERTYILLSYMLENERENLTHQQKGSRNNSAARVNSQAR